MEKTLFDLKAETGHGIALFPLDHYPQDVGHWIRPNRIDYDIPLLFKEEQQRYALLFYDHQYGQKSPWSKAYVESILYKPAPDDILSIVASHLMQFDNKDKTGDEVGYGENFRSYADQWIHHIRENINLDGLSNLVYHEKNRCIAITNCDGRLLPTTDVNFAGPKTLSHGYPFDRLQDTSIWLGTPLYIIATTINKAWSLVMTHDVIAWVQSDCIASVNTPYVDQWQAAAKNQLGAITKTHTPIIDRNGLFLGNAYIGATFPLVESNVSSHLIMVPVKHDGKAIIKHVSIDKEHMAAMPLPMTYHHISQILGSLAGRPYGWGNIYCYNDCSSEVRSFFTPFGIWLPRQSVAQVDYGEMVDLGHKKPRERIDYLMEHGKPFLTIVYVGGHILLYIGNYPNSYTHDGGLMAMTYQNIWGLHCIPQNSPPLIIGGSVFFPLLLQYPDEPEAASLAARDYFKMASF